MRRRSEKTKQCKEKGRERHTPTTTKSTPMNDSTPLTKTFNRTNPFIPFSPNPEDQTETGPQPDNYSTTGISPRAPTETIDGPTTIPDPAADHITADSTPPASTAQIKVLDTPSNSPANERYREQRHLPTPRNTIDRTTHAGFGVAFHPPMRQRHPQQNKRTFFHAERTDLTPTTN
jgi:hypothetical protein